jgi:hypothetical protein
MVRRHCPKSLDRAEDEEKLAKGDTVRDRNIWNTAEDVPLFGFCCQMRCGEVQERWRPRCGMRGQLRHGPRLVPHLLSRAASSSKWTATDSTNQDIPLVLGVPEHIRIDVGVFVRCRPRERLVFGPGYCPRVSAVTTDGSYRLLQQVGTLRCRVGDDIDDSGSSSDCLLRATSSCRRRLSLRARERGEPNAEADITCHFLIGDEFVMMSLSRAVRWSGSVKMASVALITISKVSVAMPSYACDAASGLALRHSHRRTGIQKCSVVHIHPTLFTSLHCISCAQRDVVADGAHQEAQTAEASRRKLRGKSDNSLHCGQNTAGLLETSETPASWNLESKCDR